MADNHDTDASNDSDTDTDTANTNGGASNDHNTINIRERRKAGETGLSLQIIEDVIYQIVYFIPLNLWFFILSVVLFRCYRQLGHLLA